jgi:hypothetical protein
MMLMAMDPWTIKNSQIFSSREDHSLKHLGLKLQDLQ